MATHSSVLAWRIPGTGEPGGLPSMGLHRVRHDWSDLAAAAAAADSILKSRDITLPTKVHLVKAMVFPVVMYGCESWTVKKAEQEELMLLTVVLEKTLESPLDSKEIKPINPKANQPWILLEGLMLKLQYFGYLMWRVNSLEKTLMLGKFEGKRRRGWQRIRWLDGITD